MVADVRSGDGAPAPAGWQSEVTPVDAPEAHFRAIFHAIAEGIIVQDLDGWIVSANPAAEQILGLSSEEMRGRTATDARWGALRQDGSPMPGDEYPSVVTLRTGQPMRDAVVGLRRSTGETVWLSVNSFPLLRPDGSTYAVATSFRDETVRKHNEDSLRRLSGIVDSSGDAIYGTDAYGHIVNWNDAAAALYGYSAAEIHGQHVGVLTPAGRVGEVELLLDAARANETTRDFHTVRRRRDGSLVDVALTVSPVRNAIGDTVGKSVIARDVSEALALKRALEHQALHDPLTGLPNRVLVADRLTHAAARRDGAGRPVALLFVDLDHFKTINDGAGHAVGDALLKEAAARLAAVVRPADTVGRFGGDEFIVVCEDCDVTEAQHVAERILQDFRRPVDVEGRQLFISASIGIASAHDIDAETMFSQADAAMYAAKARGRSRAVVFDATLGATIVERLELSHDLRAALEGNELRLHYQPIIDLESGCTTSYEALARWRHPRHGDIQPARFIEIAEESNLIGDLDSWCVRTAARAARELFDSGALPPEGHVSVNISAMNVADAALETTLREAIAAAGIPATAIRFEVTETAVMADPENASRVLSRVRELGATVALDDFGTGHSSLTYLRKLPIDAIKIDRGFICNMLDKPDELAITVSIIDLARSVHVPAIAEGIEDEEQLALLRNLGCAAGQGFLWSPAVPLDILTSQGTPRADRLPHSRRTSRGPANEVRAEHGLARMMQLHHEGASLSTIAAALNRDGFRTPRGMLWHRATVARVISSIVTRDRSAAARPTTA
ncbi:MAG: hypothetical protein QOG34_49 [Frankiaceae bacterium]|nr:hypothetical protein [Frankiaceae bacterium]